MYFLQKNIILILILFSTSVLFAQPCFPNQVVTSAFATGGTSPYKDKVLWLTWGSTVQNMSINPYGTHNQQLGVGSKSRASIHLGGNSYLCIEVEITSVTEGNVNSYAPGNYQGDSMDKLYNINGTGTNNRLVCGIINRVNGQTSVIKFKAKATINGAPIRLSGLAIADAESLGARVGGIQREYIKATAYGNWNVVDIRENLNAGAYRIAKRAVGSNQQRIEFQEGNDSNTGAVAFLEFNQNAYNTSDGFSVEFTTELKGGGLTALAIGLLTPNADLGDAPISYGAPVHLIQNLKISPDGIAVSLTTSTNINASNYNPGALTLTDGKFLGSTPPDGDYSPKHSRDALGDDTSGTGLTSEEDAWPLEYKSFSYKVNYSVGNQIATKIPFKNGQIGDRISGWIDFNLNGLFEDSERQTAQISAKDISNGYVSLNWVVPSTRVVKSTYVRLRYFDSKEDYSSPTQSVNFGEVEDHRVVILAPKLTNPMLQSNKKE